MQYTSLPSDLGSFIPEVHLIRNLVSSSPVSPRLRVFYTRSQFFGNHRLLTMPFLLQYASSATTCPYKHELESSGPLMDKYAVWNIEPTGSSQNQISLNRDLPTEFVNYYVAKLCKISFLLSHCIFLLLLQPNVCFLFKPSQLNILLWQ